MSRTTNLNPADLSQVKEAYRELFTNTIGDCADLEQWLVSWSALEFELSESYSRRYIAMYCDTVDTAKEAAFLHVVREIEPERSRSNYELRQRFLSSPFRAQLPSSRYARLVTIFEARQRVFDPRNVALEVEERELVQRYQKACGALTVSFQGQTLTVPDTCAKFMQLSRSDREQLWRLVWEVRRGLADETDAIFSELMRVRARMAQQAGFGSYIEYRFQSLNRFDYSPDDCREFHHSIARHIAPLARRLYEEQRSKLGVEQLRPWDVGAGRLFEVVVPASHSEPGLSLDTAGIMKAATTLLTYIRPQFAETLTDMDRRGELDLPSRPGKGPGAFMQGLEKSNRPFIFMNAAGIEEDLFVLLHEFGHAVHCLELVGEPLSAYRDAGMEICEVASTSMELFSFSHLEKVMPKALARHLRTSHLRKFVLFFCYLAQVDAFQLWIYEHPEHTQTERRAQWSALEVQFGGPFDWSGIEAYREVFWQQQLHIIEFPFYYVEYGIAQLGALQLMQRQRRLGSKAIDDYLSALRLGASRALPELFQAAGIAFDFSDRVVAELAHSLEAELARNVG